VEIFLFLKEIDVYLLHFYKMKKTSSNYGVGYSQRGITLEDAVVALGDLVLPRDCIVCGRQLRMKEKHLCIYCMADLPLTYFWDRVHNPMADKYNAKIQEILAHGDTERYEYAAALFFYQSESGYKKIPQQLKYHSNLSAGRFFSHLLGLEMADSPIYQNVDCIIPVPLYWSRKWERGYNQAAIVAQEIAKVLGAVVNTSVLYRAKHTKTQTKLSIEDKRNNVSTAFKIHDKELVSLRNVRHILLVDDVFTTGATLTACFTVLRKALSTYPPPTSSTGTAERPYVRISIATLGFVSNI
jgi:ComF family protein